MTKSNRFVSRGGALTVASAGLALLLGCVAVFSPDTSANTDPVAQPRGIAMDFFPFQDTASKWWYSDESRLHRVYIHVADMITDNDGVTYYKVVFEEDSSDTNDWFQENSSGIQYATSLVGGKFMPFLPDSFSDTVGSFTSDSALVRYHYSDSLTLSGKLFRKVMDLRYAKPFVHGFGRMVFADSVGIVGLIDTTGRFGLTYSLDSAYVHGATRRY